MSNRPLADLHREAERALNRGAFEHAHACCIEILRRDAGFADAYFLLGMIALAHGRAAKALELIDRALASSGGRADYLAQRARCLVLLQRDPEAHAAAHEALSLEPSDALTLDTLGVVLSKVGDHGTAVAAFERAVARQPDNAEFRFNLGSSQQFVGAIDEAGQSYEQAVRLKPEFFRAHWALSELGPAEQGVDRVAQLEKLLEAHRDNPDAVLYLCHAMAKENERAGNYARAFEHWRRGKAAKRSGPEFSAADFARLFEAIRVQCTAEFVGTVGGHPSAEPIFVVGMPRTGTTLVEQMLGCLDDVFAAGELDAFGLALKRATHTPSNRILDIETVQSAASVDFAALGRDYIDLTRPRTGHKRHFVDKLPTNFLYAGFIHRALPNARLVCLNRNPLDTCLSNYRQLFSVRTPYYAYSGDLLDTGRYYVEFRRLIDHWQKVLPADRFLLVQYEALVADAPKEARRLVEFCGLPWDERVLGFHASGQSAATASAAQVRKPIYGDAVGRWKRYRNELAPLIELLRANGIDVE